MEVKGEAMISLPIFIIKKFGNKAFMKWLNELTPDARKVYSSPINKNQWFPIESMLTEPTIKICDIFYNGSMLGAWECGRFSAEYGLKGISRILAKLSSPEVLIKKAAMIFQNYYKPSELIIHDYSSEHVIVHITKFTGFNEYIENRIAGWMQRAIEISGCKHVTVKIPQSLTKHNPVTEYIIYWK